MTLKTPRPRLPKLNALRSFEAAARHESFAAAADELGVTPGAIAQQVKSLEGWFGQDLFHRHGHGVRLTDQAKAALPTLIMAFDNLGGAVRELNDLTRNNKISIAALPAIAQLWLTPRLPQLYDALPGVEISISALEEPPNLNRELYDLALFRTDRTIPDGGIELSEDIMEPVCSPSLLKGSIPLSEPADLAHHVLLHDAAWKDDWSRWLHTTGACNFEPTLGPKYSLYSMAVQAAINGAGVLMGHRLFIKDALADGLLVALFDQPVPSGKALTLYLPEQPESTGVRLDLVEWLRAESQMNTPYTKEH